MSITFEAVERLARYRAILRRFKTLGLVRVFSDNLGDAAGLSASQVRKDFLLFGIRGARRGGYRIDELIERIDRLLGGGGPMRTVVIGCGNIGGALMRTYGVMRDGVSIIAGFDADPALVDPAATPPVLDASGLRDYLTGQNIRVVILAVPERAVASVVEQLRGTGVHGILNFAPVPLRETGDWIVHNIDIRLEIEKLFHHIGFSGIAGPDARALPPASATPKPD